MTPDTLMQLLTSTPVRVVDAQSAVSGITRSAVTVAESCTLAEAAETMRAVSSSALLVGNHPDIVTERDLARGLAAGYAADDPVALVATPQPVAVRAASTVHAAAALMLNEHVRHLVVESDSGTLGIVSIRDLLAVLLRAANEDMGSTSRRVSVDAPPEVWLG